MLDPASLLGGVASNLLYDSLKLGTFALYEWIAGPPEDRALRAAYQEALANETDPIVHALLTLEGVAGRLLAPALVGDLTSAAQHRALLARMLPRAAVPTGFDEAMARFSRNLRVNIETRARGANSPLANIVQHAQLAKLREEEGRTRVEIAQTLTMGLTSLATRIDRLADTIAPTVVTTTGDQADPLVFRRPRPLGLGDAPRIEGFLASYLGDSAHPVPFGGRDDALAALDRWCADSSSYALLVAPAGRGKSALLARWVARLAAEHRAVVVYVPVSVRFGTASADVAFRELALQLTAAHGVAIPRDVRTAADWLALAQGLLRLSWANDRPLVVILDGLDEALGWRADAALIPATAPRGLRAIATARPLAGDAVDQGWRERLGWERPDVAFSLTLPGLSPSAIRSLVTESEIPQTLDTRVDLARELTRLSGGDPLLVGLYLAALRPGRDAQPPLDPTALPATPPGLRGYFARWLAEQEQLWGPDRPLRERATRATLYLLARACGPLPNALLRDLLREVGDPLDPLGLREVLRSLGRFVIGDGREQGYAYSHPGLADYWADELNDDERRGRDAAYAAVCARAMRTIVTSTGPGDPPDPYIIRFGTTHLARAKSPLGLWRMVSDRRWWEATERLGEGPGPFLGDVDRALVAVGGSDLMARATNIIPDLADALALLLARASVRDLNKQLPASLFGALAASGHWSPARLLATLREHPSAVERAQALALAAPHLPDPYETAAWEGALQGLAWLDNRSPLTETGVEADPLSILLARLPDALIPLAWEHLAAIEDPLRREWMVRHFANRRRFAPAATLLRVLATFDPAADPTHYAGTLAALAPALPDEALAAGLQTLLTTSGPSVITIVTADPDQRLPPGVIQIVEATVPTLDDPVDRAVVLARLATTAPNPGRVDRALGALGAAIARLENADGAGRPTPRRLDSQIVLAMAWVALAPSLAENSALAAVELGRRLPSPHAQQVFLGAVLARLDDAKLRDVLREVPTLRRRSRGAVLLALAEAVPPTLAEAVLSEAGDARVEEARLLLAARFPEQFAATALAAAAAARDDAAVNGTIQRLADTMPAGLLPEALRQAGHLAHPRATVASVAALAPRLDGAGARSALALLARIPLDDRWMEWPSEGRELERERALALPLLLPRLETDSLPDIEAIAEATRPIWGVGIRTATLARFGWSDARGAAARETANALPTPRLQAAWLGELALLAPPEERPGLLDEALERGRRIGDGWELARARLALAVGTFSPTEALDLALADDAYLQPERLAILIPLLPDDELRRALAILRTGDSAWVGALWPVALALAGRGDGTAGATLIGALPREARPFARALMALAPHCSADALSAFPDLITGFHDDHDAAVIFVWQYVQVVAALPREADQRPSLARRARALIERVPALGALRITLRRGDRGADALAIAGAYRARRWSPGETLVRAFTLAAVAPWLPDEELHVLVRSTIERCPPLEQGTLWSLVAPALPIGVVERAVTSLREGDTLVAASALPPLLVRLAGADRVGEVCRIASVLPQVCRARALTGIALVAPGDPDGPDLAALVSLLVTLPERNAISDGAGEAGVDDTAEWRSDTLAALAPHLPDTALPNALRFALTAEREGCELAVASLAHRASSLALPEAYRLWEAASDELLGCSRGQLGRSLTLLCPLLEGIGGDRTRLILDRALAKCAIDWP